MNEKIDREGKLYIAGHTGLFGSALCEIALRKGYSNLVVRSHEELDLTRQRDTELFFEEERPRYVMAAAALVGGIQANKDRMADFCMVNLEITCNLLHAAHNCGVEKFLYLGSSCIYPRECAQPIPEEAVLSGSCEPTNEGYAIAKIAGIRLCEYYKRQYGDNFISCIPANVYGPRDCFEDTRAHVIPSLIGRFYRAKRDRLPSVTVWGTGRAEREFLYIDDAALGCIQLFEQYNGSRPVNLGVGRTTSIGELAKLISRVVGYEGEIRFDSSKPDGMRGRLLDDRTARELGIRARTSLEEGILKTYRWYLEEFAGGG